MYYTQLTGKENGLKIYISDGPDVMIDSGDGTILLFGLKCQEGKFRLHVSESPDEIFRLFEETSNMIAESYDEW